MSVVIDEVSATVEPETRSASQSAQSVWSQPSPQPPEVERERRAAEMRMMERRRGRLTAD